MPHLPQPPSAGGSLPPSPRPPGPYRQRRDSGSGSGFEAQESWERLSDGGKGGPEEPGDSPPLRHRVQGPPPPSLFRDQPDLTCLIDTNFSVQPRLSEPTQPEPRHRASCGRARDNPGYDFSRLVQRVYQQEGLAPVHTPALRPPSPGPTLPQAPEDEGCSPEKGSLALSWAPSADGSIWSLELQGSLIVVGRSSGRLEVGSRAGGRGAVGFCSLHVLTASGLAGLGCHRGHTVLQQRGGLLRHHGPHLPGQKVSVRGCCLSPDSQPFLARPHRGLRPGSLSLRCDSTPLLSAAHL